MEQIAQWVAPIATTIAALMTAANLGARITGFGFIVFTVGSLAWLAIGHFSGDPSLVWQNVVLTALNLFGVWRWLGRQARIEQGGRAAAEQSLATPGEALFPVSLLAKARVSGVSGEELGTAVDAMAGASSGRLAYLVVSAGGLAGVGETLRRLEWSAARVADEEIRTGLDEGRFSRLEQLDKDDWPGR